MNKNRYSYFNLEYAIREHRFIINESGGRQGYADEKIGLLESVLHHVQDDVYYPELTDKVAHLVFGINKNHTFTDGNKRASLALSSFFLEINGFDHVLAKYMRGMEEVVVWVAASLIDINTLKEIIKFLIYEDPTHVACFIEQAKEFRSEIESDECRICKDLLSRMVHDWLSEDVQLSEETKVELLEVLSGDV